MRSNAELVSAIRGSLPASMEWTERDVALLELAESQARDLDTLEGLVARGEADPFLGVVRECRNQRVALGRLIGLVDVPLEVSTASVHAAKAARSRWRDREAG